MCDLEEIAAFSAMLRCHYFFVNRIEIEPVRVGAHVLTFDFYLPMSYLSMRRLFNYGAPLRPL
jgi:hypothetical protein